MWCSPCTAYAVKHFTTMKFNVNAMAILTTMATASTSNRNSRLKFEIRKRYFLFYIIHFLYCNRRPCLPRILTLKPSHYAGVMMAVCIEIYIYREKNNRYGNRSGNFSARWKSGFDPPFLSEMPVLSQDHCDGFQIFDFCPDIASCYTDFQEITREAVFNIILVSNQ